MVRTFLRGINVSFLLLIIISTFSSCANELNVFEENNNKQINFLISVPEWKNTDSLATTKTSRAAPIMDTSFGTDKSFNLIADQNDGAGNYSTLIDKESVSFTNNIWQTTPSHYYWSGTANKTVNFYAYYPTSISGNISHTADSSPTLLYTVPPDASNQIDIIIAINPNISGSTVTSTSLTFNHIFSAVKFAVGTNGLPSGTIKSITISGINNSGTYTFGSGWTLGPSTSAFTVTPSTTITGVAGANITSDAFTLMMIPQVFSNADVSLVYNNGTTFSAKISGIWNAGGVYTYKLSKTIVSNYDYTAASQTFTAPYTGTYKIECWGAQGGTDSSDSITAGKGGYAQGLVKLNKDQVLYIYIGGQGGPTASTGTAGYNGGGLGGLYSGPNVRSGGGGGATHIASILGLLYSLSSNKNSVYLVAGGGGGYCHGGADNDKHYGGTGGGANGGNSLEPYNTGLVSYGATQTTGYQFGKGQDGHNANGGGWGGEAGSGCGGGWFGGNASQQTGDNTNSGGSGGSGYIGGVSNGSMQNGVRSGNGYARITFVSAN